MYLYPMTFPVCCDPQDPMDCQERAECAQAGLEGHSFCGMCARHAVPKHRCGCAAAAMPEEKPTVAMADIMEDVRKLLMR